MKVSKGTWATIVFLGLMGFISVMLISTGSKYECEVCISYNGYDVCQTVEGMDKNDTVQTGISTACAGAASGRTETMDCGMTQPTKVMCKKL